MINQRILPLLAVTLGLALGAVRAQETPAEITGRILNATADKPMANMEFAIVKPGPDGMQTVKTLRSDGEGRFRIPEAASLLGSPHLLQVEYKSVSYSHMIRAKGKLTDIELKVYETTQSMDGIRISLPHMMIRREGDLLRIDEIYQVENPTDKAYVAADGFRFQIPKEATRITGVSVGTPGSTMPIQQTPNKNADGSGYHVTNAIKPGLTQVHVAYEASYAGGKASLKKKFFYPLVQFNLFVSPEDIQVASNLLKDTTTESTGFRTLRMDMIPRDAEVTLELSGGSSRPPEPAPGTGAAPAEEQSTRVTVIPPAISRYRVLILVNLAILLAAFVGWRLTSREDSTGVERVAQLARKGGRGKLLKQRESLIDQLAELDDRWESRSLPEADYQKRRQILKGRLKEFTVALESERKSAQDT